MPVQRPPRPLPVLASALAAAGLVLAAAGCSHITPLGPDRRLWPCRRHAIWGHRSSCKSCAFSPPHSTGGCPAGWAAVSLPVAAGRA